MNIETIEKNIKLLINNHSESSFLYDLLRAYGTPKASITRLIKGDYNLSKEIDEVLWKKKLFFKKEMIADLHNLIDELQHNTEIIKHHPRFIIVTNFSLFLSVDMKTRDTLDIPFHDLSKHAVFFMPWTGQEKMVIPSDTMADTKAAISMGRLYDLIIDENADLYYNQENKHSLNVFLSRLLFCYFAEDTNIFKQNQFTTSVASHTSANGSDLQAYLERFFKVLNQEERSEYPQFLQDFPYVNGGLFSDDICIPKFSTKSRQLIVDCGSLNWKEINPDILGSMMQAVVHKEERSNLGMHYTSVTNIMKVIEPLFLNDLKENLENCFNDEKKLIKLLDRLYHLRIFDPACGSGNFLVIAYKELCKIELEIYKQLQKIDNKWNFAISGVLLKQFYGIEVDDFAHETAKLSLWLAEHQMNIYFEEVFGEPRPTLPLQASGNIVQGNATQLEWEKICPKNNKYETYILGNPPYLGSSLQSKNQKLDMQKVFHGIKNYKNLDYITCWLLLGARYIKNTNFKLAFVSTNSICQGEQVALIWPWIFELNLEIHFAYQSFKWVNKAKANAGVTCVIIGLRNRSNKPKFIFNNGFCDEVKNITPYLTKGKNFILTKKVKPLSDLPMMINGNKAVDGGNLIFANDHEKNKFLQDHRGTERFIKKLIGSKEFMQNSHRWCIWICDNEKEEAMDIPGIKERVAKVSSVRLASTDKGANKIASRSYRFRDQRLPNIQSLFVPAVSSERRDYIPVGFLDKDVVVVAPNFAIFDPPLYIFAVISSRMHMTWVRALAGRLKTDYRYSSALCYNTFPFPNISEKQKLELKEAVFEVLDAREYFSEKTISELYDPDKMPEKLIKAHYEMDLTIEKCYRISPFKSDEDRLELLFDLYEEMTLYRNSKET